MELLRNESKKKYTCMYINWALVLYEWSGGRAASEFVKCISPILVYVSVSFRGPGKYSLWRCEQIYFAATRRCKTRANEDKHGGQINELSRWLLRLEIYRQ